MDRSGFTEHCRYKLELLESSIRLYVHHLEGWERDLGKEPEAITEDDWMTWRRCCGFAPETQKSRLTALKSYRRWKIALGEITPNGIELLKVRRARGRKLPPLPLSQARRLLSSCRHPLEFRLVHYGLLEGCRPMESAAMDEDHWQDGWLVFVGKGGKEREVPVHPALEAVRDRILDHPPVHKSTLYKVRTRMAQRVGIFFRPQQLRRTFGVSLDEEGVTDRVLKELLGHGDDVTDRYVMVSRRRKQEGHARLPYGGSQLSLF